jgi:hypothetical protein
MKRASGPAVSQDQGQALIAIFVIIGLIFFTPILLRYGMDMVLRKGIDVARAECEWNQDKLRYETVFVVYNTEHLYKTMLANARVQFRPPLGKGWPDRTTRQMFRVATKPMNVVFEPEGNIEEKPTFTVPDTMTGFSCSASVQVLGQKRYTARPSIQEVEAAPESIREGWLYRLGQRLKVQ